MNEQNDKMYSRFKYLHFLQLSMLPMLWYVIIYVLSMFPAPIQAFLKTKSCITSLQSKYFRMSLTVTFIKEP